MDTRIVAITEDHAASFRECLDVVAREKRYLAQIEAPPLERVQAFVRESVTNGSAQFVAIADDRVVGWADIFPAWPHAISHCGSLGMAVLPEYRGQGIGKRLLESCIAKACLLKHGPDNTKRRATGAFIVSACLPAAVWALSVPLTGKAEPWDAEGRGRFPVVQRCVSPDGGI